MPENRDYITSSDQNGSISISEDVVSAIAALAIREVDGVVCDTTTDTDRRSLAKFLHITPAGDNVVNADVSVKVRYGVKIPAVAAALQQAVAQAVDSMAGLTVDTVNVKVVGLVFSEKVDE